MIIRSWGNTLVILSYRTTIKVNISALLFTLHVRKTRLVKSLSFRRGLRVRALTEGWASCSMSRMPSSQNYKAPFPVVEADTVAGAESDCVA